MPIIILFWVCLGAFVFKILTSTDTTGAGMFMFFTYFFMSQHLYLLLVPVGIFGVGMRNSKEPLWKALFIWGSIAMMVYTAMIVAGMMIAMS